MSVSEARRACVRGRRAGGGSRLNSFDLFRRSILRGINKRSNVRGTAVPAVYCYPGVRTVRGTAYIQSVDIDTR